jgi:hypothetical protein
MGVVLMKPISSAACTSIFSWSTMVGDEELWCLARVRKSSYTPSSSNATVVTLAAMKWLCCSGVEHAVVVTFATMADDAPSTRMTLLVAGGDVDAALR